LPWKPSGGSGGGGRRRGLWGKFSFGGGAFSARRYFSRTVRSTNSWSEAGCGEPELDFGEVKGQQHVKRAVEVAAAGGHNILTFGPIPAGTSPSFALAVEPAEQIDSIKSLLFVILTRGELQFWSRRHERTPFESFALM
jgi:hypothetical protein